MADYIATGLMIAFLIHGLITSKKETNEAKRHYSAQNGRT